MSMGSMRASACPGSLRPSCSRASVRPNRLLQHVRALSLTRKYHHRRLDRWAQFGGQQRREELQEGARRRSPSSLQERRSRAFSSQRRAAALSIVLSAFGLSAFFCAFLARPRRPPSAADLLKSAFPHADSTLSSLFLHSRASGDATPAFLLLLALGSLFSTAVGLVFVRPVPLAARTADSDPDRAAEEAPAEVEAAFSEADDVSQDGPAVVVVPSSISPPSSGTTSSERTPLLRSDSTKSVQERDITGWALLHELDFFLIFAFNALCAGVGLCCASLSLSLLPLPPVHRAGRGCSSGAELLARADINNLGTVVRSLALAAPNANPSLTDFSPAAAPDSVALLQSRLVSLLSIFNFAGRLLSGFLSDSLLHSPPRPLPRIPRVAFLPFTASILVASQLVAFRTERAEHLWAATALTGLAHGCLFGISGIVGLERFGLKHFSQTNGFLALAPALSGASSLPRMGRRRGRAEPRDARAQARRPTSSSAASTTRTFSPLRPLLPPPRFSPPPPAPAPSAASATRRRSSSRAAWRSARSPSAGGSRSAGRACGSGRRRVRGCNLLLSTSSSLSTESPASDRESGEGAAREREQERLEGPCGEVNFRSELSSNVVGPSESNERWCTCALRSKKASPERSKRSSPRSSTPTRAARSRAPPGPRRPCRPRPC